MARVGFGEDAPHERFSWETVRWRDGSTFEGLLRERKRASDDGSGVDGGGYALHAGRIRYRGGDTYEGEFRDDAMEGLGVYVWKAKGGIYRGEWRGGNMHGCGVKLHRMQDGSIAPEEGEFVDDKFIGPHGACSIDRARLAAWRADEAVASTRRLYADTVGPPRPLRGIPAAVARWAARLRGKV